MTYYNHELIDQELSLEELEDINGAAPPLLIIPGVLGGAALIYLGAKFAGWVAKKAANDVADKVTSNLDCGDSECSGDSNKLSFTPKTGETWDAPWDFSKK
tara:strand:- start:2814 stop:3116 length:303 start_codon:yes stop_codon:yes gene_type:complete